MTPRVERAIAEMWRAVGELTPDERVEVLAAYHEAFCWGCGVRLDASTCSCAMSAPAQPLQEAS